MEIRYDRTGQPYKGERFFSRGKPAQCPKCESPRMVLILYGLPGPREVAFAKEGLIALGGCMMTGDDAKWECWDCHTCVWPVEWKPQ